MQDRAHDKLTNSPQDPQAPTATGLLNAVVVSGLSGAGKSQALKVLEDLGYFCIDNLPLPMLRSCLDFCRSSEQEISRVAIGMDVRAGRQLEAISQALSDLRSEGQPLEVLFLEADDKTLFTRFRESRRPHPLEAHGSIPEKIGIERQALRPLREVADWILDTSGLSIHELRRRLIQHFEPAASGSMQVTLLSFGYRYGVPFEADLVFDVRFLPNPHFVPDLREHDGRNPDVSGYVFQQTISQEFMGRLEPFLEFLLPQYQREGKTYLTIAVGCTGGKHRSVAVVEALRGLIERSGLTAAVRHRDLDN